MLSREFGRLRQLWGLPFTPISQWPDGGWVKLRARIRQPNDLTSPLQEKPCVYWGVLAKGWVKDNHSNRWLTLIDTSQAPDVLLLEDATGTAEFVWDHACHALFRQDFSRRAKPFLKLPAPLRHRLAQVRPDSWGTPKRAVEYRLESGDELIVTGWATRKDGSRVLTQHDGHILFISDLSEPSIRWLLALAVAKDALLAFCLIAVVTGMLAIAVQSALGQLSP